MLPSYQAQKYKVYELDGRMGQPSLPVVMVSSSQGFLWDTDMLLNEFQQTTASYYGRGKRAATALQDNEYASSFEWTSTRKNSQVAEIQLDDDMDNFLPHF